MAASKRKQSRKEKRLHKKLQKLEAELPSSDDEEGGELLTTTTRTTTAAAPTHKDTNKNGGGKPKTTKQPTKPKQKGKAVEEEEESSDDRWDDADASLSEADDESESSGEEEKSHQGEGESFDEQDADDDNDDDDDKGDDDNARQGKDGMADVMARILNQEIVKKTPVLAKRKTALMKDMEKDFKEKARAKEAAEKKRAALNHQLHIPDHTDAEKERGLRRIATRGVVALFNAITKARTAREEGGGDGEGKTGKGKSTPGAAKDMSKNDFLQMLKSSTSKTGSKATTSNNKTDAGWSRDLGGGGGGGEGGPTESSWNAIKDDYLMSAPKINDFEDSEDEGELEGEGIMSESEEEDCLDL